MLFVVVVANVVFAVMLVATTEFMRMPDSDALVYSVGSAGLVLLIPFVLWVRGKTSRTTTVTRPKHATRRLITNSETAAKGGWSDDHDDYAWGGMTYEELEAAGDITKGKAMERHISEHWYMDPAKKTGQKDD